MNEKQQKSKDQHEPITWSLEQAMQDLENSFNWLWLDEEDKKLFYWHGENTVADIVVRCDGDVNLRRWHNSILTNHPLFIFNGSSDKTVKLTKTNYTEFKEVLQWYEGNVINIEKPWENKQ